VGLPVDDKELSDVDKLNKFDGSLVGIGVI